MFGRCRHDWSSGRRVRTCLKCGTEEFRCPECGGKGGRLISTETIEYCAEPSGCYCGDRGNCYWDRSATRNVYEPDCEKCRNQGWAAISTAELLRRIERLEAQFKPKLT